MKISIRKGFGFGLTSGIITTLGLIIGLSSGTNSKIVVLAGIFVIAIADALSDALGIHISEEAGSKSTTPREVWESTISTFIFKFVFAMIFIIPVLLLTLQNAVLVSAVVGLILIAVFSYHIAKQNETNPTLAVAEHILITVVVIIATHFVGKWIATLTI